MSLRVGTPPAEILMALPVSLRDDLRLLDAEISRSLELIADMSGAQLTDLALTFSVARPTLNGFEDVSLRGDGGEEVTEGNVQEFARLRATADLGGQQAKSIGCLIRGFRDVVPEATLLLLDPEELREALALEGKERGSGGLRRNCGVQGHPA